MDSTNDFWGDERIDFLNGLGLDGGGGKGSTAFPKDLRMALGIEVRHHGIWGKGFEGDNLDALMLDRLLSLGVGIALSIDERGDVVRVPEVRVGGEIHRSGEDDAERIVR